MNWLHFITWVTGIYALYYLVNILIDNAGGKRAPADKSSINELTFSEDIQTKRLEHDPENETAANNKTGDNKPAAKINREPEVIASGGLSLKDFFSGAKQEAFIYTRAVSFSS